MTQKVYEMTYEGIKELQDELEYRKTELSIEIAERLKEARALGDLSENSEYDDAKDAQAKNEVRIADIEVILKNAKVIEDTDISSDQVTLGSKVKLLDVEYNEELVYTIVGSLEEDIFKNKISNESPVGNAIMGCKAGDTVKVRSLAGELEYKILEIYK
ncbi:MAG TPA: transcription elongation factor GreA [Clostridiaceae bacterium]|nr:transcription elongation factor GreA [Clostridiaceae bacterium]